MSLARSLSVARRVAVNFTAAPVRFFSDTQFAKKEAAAERDFINRQERELLRKIISKYDRLDAEENAGQIQSSLEEILSKHKVTATPALVADLKKWRSQ